MNVDTPYRAIKDQRKERLGEGSVTFDPNVRHFPSLPVLRRAIPLLEGDPLPLICFSGFRLGTVFVVMLNFSALEVNQEEEALPKRPNTRTVKVPCKKFYQISFQNLDSRSSNG
jgi:hypothetical protein